MNTGNLLHENTRLDLLFNFATKTYAASRICIRSLNLQQARSLHNHVGNVCSWLSVIAQNDPSRLIGKNFLYELKDDSKKWDKDIFLIPATPRTLFETPDNWNAVSGVIMFRRLCMVYIALNEWIQELSDFDGKIEPCCHLFNFIGKMNWNDHLELQEAKINAEENLILFQDVKDNFAITNNMKEKHCGLPCCVKGCKKPAKGMCIKCHGPSYCGKKCQTEHYLSEHKCICKAIQRNRKRFSSAKRYLKDLDNLARNGYAQDTQNELFFCCP